MYNGARIALSERGNELACLRVLGYTRGEIGRILLGEQGLLILASIPAGFMLGFGLSLLLSLFFSRELFRLPLVVNAGSYAFAAIIVMAAAIFSGLVVGQRLAPYGLNGGIEIEGMRIVMNRIGNRVVTTLATIAVAILVALAFRPKPTEVDAGILAKGPLR